MNRYEAAARENEARIAELRDRIARWEGGPRASRIPAMKEEIARLEKQVPTLRGTGKLVQQMYGGQ